MSRILDDDDIRSRVDARDAVRWMGEAIDAHHRGDLVAPPRAHADLGAGRVMFTGTRPDELYVTFPVVRARPAPA